MLSLWLLLLVEAMEAADRKKWHETEDHVAHSTLVLWRIHTSDSLNFSYLEDCEPTKSKTIGPDVVVLDTALCSQ